MKKIIKKIFLGIVAILICFVVYIGYLIFTFGESQPMVLRHRPINMEIYSNLADGKVITEFKGWKRGIQVDDLDEKLKNYANEIMDIVQNTDINVETEKTIEMNINANEEAKLLEAIDNTYYIPDSFGTKGYNLSYEKLSMKKVKDNEYVIDVIASQFALDDVKYYKETIEKIVNDVVKIGMTEKEAVLQVNNALCDWIVNKSYDHANTQHLGITTGEGDLKSFVSSFQIICEYIGIDSEIVVGELKIRNKIYQHVWNKVKFDGQNEYYYIDVYANNERNNAYNLTDKLWEDHLLSFLNK